jgi:hypothetical protein
VFSFANVKPTTHEEARLIPRPKALAPEQLSRIVHAQEPDQLTLLVASIAKYIVRVDLELPGDILSWLHDVTLARWAAEYINANGGSPQAPSEAWLQAFMQAMSHFVFGEVRAPAVVALEDLMLGKVQQGSQPVARYAEQFFMRARQLQSESQVSLCAYYLRGLRPDLRARCRLDNHAREWTDLATLVQFSYGEELRLQALHAY